MTRGGHGLGSHLAEALAGAGASVGLIGRAAGRLDETEEALRHCGGTVAASVADVSGADAGAGASGEADRLSGCHVSVLDDLDALIQAADRIRMDELHTLRLRQLP